MIIIKGAGDFHQPKAKRPLFTFAKKLRMSVSPNSVKPLATTSTACFHCGEDCPDDGIRLEDKAFCCHGCKTVYEILNANDLCKYYQLDENAGISLKARKKQQYAYLDDPEIVEALIDFTDGKATKVTFSLPQIHCASCIWLLENLYKLNDGILSSTVNFLKKEAYISFSNKTTTLRALVELLASIGYAPEINLGNLDKPPAKAVDRSFYYQLGIAGFAFGNIMLLSFPEYLGLDNNSGAWFQRVFGYLNILLVVPVVFYSGKGYLQSAWQGLRQRHLNIDVPISLGILTLFGRSVFEILAQSGAGYLDSLAGLVFFLLIGKWFQQKTYHRFSFERDYKSYFPIAATILKDKKEHSAPLYKLAIGDTVLIRNQELIPADGLLKKGRARIDYSFVTGESEPVERAAGEKLFAGGRQMGDAIELLLAKKVSQSYLMQLWNEAAFQEENPSGISQLSDKIGRYFTTTVLAIAFLTLFYWLPKDASLAVNAFTSVLIIACPCAVALSIPFIFGNVQRIFAKRGFYLKNTTVIENLNEVTAVVFDKTGTITKVSQNEVYFSGKELSEEEKIWVKSLVRHSGHPISRQIADYFKNSPVQQVEKFEEITGSGLQGFVNQHFVRIGSWQFISKNKEEKLLQRGSLLEIDGQQKGFFSVQNTYRKGLNNLLQNWQNRYRIFLLSGDNEREKPVLKKFFPPKTTLHFNQQPKDKLDFVQHLQKQSEKVLMLGDGLNDAGALKQSEVGIVIAEDTNNFTPACDAILEARQFALLPKFTGFVKAAIRLVYYAYALAFVYNAIGLSFAVQGVLSPVIAAILMPLSSITVVAFGVGTSSLLAYEKGISD